MSVQMMFQRRPAHGSLILASLLAVALAIIPVATCLAAVAGAPDSHAMACCAGLTDGCADARSTQGDCCAVQSADVVQRGSVARPAASMAFVTPNTATAEIGASLAGHPPGAGDSRIVKTSSPPTYLLVSVFRI